MVKTLRCQATETPTCWGRMAGAVAGVLLLSLVAPGVAQEPPVHYLHQGIMPPGAIGAVQLQRGGPLPGYFQPVEIRTPQGVRVSLSVGGEFAPAEPGPIRAGLLIGQVYRLRVTNIPLHEGEEVFPSVEVIDRLYPPRGQEVRFPIVIELTFDDILLALDNKFVTRVIYLEDPQAPCRSASTGRSGSRRRPARIRWLWPTRWAGRRRSCGWERGCPDGIPDRIPISSSVARLWSSFHRPLPRSPRVRWPRERRSRENRNRRRRSGSFPSVQRVAKAFRRSVHRAWRRVCRCPSRPSALGPRRAWPSPGPKTNT